MPKFSRLKATHIIFSVVQSSRYHLTRGVARGCRRLRKVNLATTSVFSAATNVERRDLIVPQGLGRTETSDQSLGSGVVSPEAFPEKPRFTSEPGASPAATE